jgi:hypothetical protein
MNKKILICGADPGIGTAVLAQLHVSHPHLEVIMVTPDEALKERRIQLGQDPFVLEPIAFEEPQRERGITIAHIPKHSIRYGSDTYDYVAPNLEINDLFKLPESRRERRARERRSK